jgi:hypothetical protein
MDTLSDSFLQFLITQLDDGNTVGITWSGSYARGEDGPYCDVDIDCHVRQMPSNAAEAAYLGYGVAGLRLYCETARLLQNILRPEDATIVTRKLAIIVEAGY